MRLAHTILIAIKAAAYIARPVATGTSVILLAIKFTGESGCWYPVRKSIAASAASSPPFQCEEI